MASEIFTADGIWKTPVGTFIGSEEISKSRHQAWEKCEWRQIDVLKVYGHDEQGRELILLGRSTWKNKDGTGLTGDFVARADIEDGGGGPRLKLFQGWLSLD
jgi:hypothetical protein